MKIGILTLPLHTNYGGVLQAYALMDVLKKMGHEAWLINRKNRERSIWLYPLILLKRVVDKYVLRKQNVIIFRDMKHKKEYPIISQHTQSFIEKCITPQTEPFYSTKDLTRNISKYKFDAIIVGSDQVWRPEYTPSIGNYFLDFTNNISSIKRISYAASFGTSQWKFSKKETRVCRSLLQKFDAVSVRESDGIELCRSKFDVPAVHVLDPTMLLETADFLSLLPTVFWADKNSLLVYILDETKDKTKVVDIIATTLQLEPFKTNSSTDDLSLPLAERIAKPIEKWVEGFYLAQFVLTDSFHACVFSILFNKPFIVYGNVGRGMSRFTSLLSMFELEDRLILSSDQLDTVISKPINWERVNQILTEKRAESITFLTNALK